MNPARLLFDEDAVTPVIGVILMVAVTVILAAVIGTFVLGLGSQLTGESPTVNFEFDFEGGGDFTASDADDLMTVTHRGGDELDRKEITVNVDGRNVATNGPCYTTDWPASISAGDGAVIDETADPTCDDLFESGDSVRIVWKQEDGEATNIIGRETVP